MKTQEGRFWSKVSRLDGGCWLWNGTRGHGGYGMIRFNGRLMKAHRVAWLLTNGKIPREKQVCHTCDEPSCCNPTHLWIGTQSENLADMYKKGRHRRLRGPINRGRKLTRQLAAQIRSERPHSKIRELATKYGVTISTIHHVLSGKTWR